MSADQVTPVTGNEREMQSGGACGLHGVYVGRRCPRCAQISEVEGTVPSAWYLDMKRERDRLVVALSAATTERDEGRRELAALCTEHEAEQDFLAASVAVWRSIDEREAMPGGYSAQPLMQDTELRKVERAAWERYRDACAAAGGAANKPTLNEPERWPCGCVKGETPHGAGWADCEVAAAGAAPNEAEQR